MVFEIISSHLEKGEKIWFLKYTRNINLFIGGIKMENTNKNHLGSMYVQLLSHLKDLHSTQQNGYLQYL